MISPQPRRPARARSTTRVASPKGAPRPSRASRATDDSTDLCEVACVDQAMVSRARRLAPPAAQLTSLAEVFRALGDPTRLRILTLLAHAELCVCDLTTLTEVSESAVSHSLRSLRQLQLVRFRKTGKIAYYSIDDSHVAGLIAEGLLHIRERTR